MRIAYRKRLTLAMAFLATTAMTEPESTEEVAPTLDALVAAERSFSALSVEKGARDAFLAFLAEDGILFQPLATDGKQAWQARKPSPDTLVWEPAYAELSAAGDLGYTTGPWELRPAADTTGAPPPSARVAHGHFVSVWQKQPFGAWRVVLDIGISHARPERGVGSGDFAPGPAHAARAPRGGPPDLMAFDRYCSRIAALRGAAAAFTERAAADVRYYREGALPRVGLDAARAAFAAASGRPRWLPQGARVARSHDLGYTHGVLERAREGARAPDSSVFVNIWRRGRDGRWRMAMVVDNPLPQPKPRL